MSGPVAFGWLCLVCIVLANSALDVLATVVAGCLLVLAVAGVFVTSRFFYRVFFQ